MSTSSTSSKTSAVSGFAEKNEAFLKAYKKSNNIKTQMVLPTAIDMHNSWAVQAGASIGDAQTWRRLMELAGREVPDIVSHETPQSDLVHSTLDFAEHLDISAVELIAFARKTYGIATWNQKALDRLQDTMLADAGNDDLEIDLDDSPRNPTSAEAYELDTPASSKRKLEMIDLTEEPDE